MGKSSFAILLLPVKRLAGRSITMTRLILLGAVPALALAAACDSFSACKVDKAAGFNGSFEFVKSGYPANWSIYHHPLNAGDADMSFDTADKVDGRQSLKFVVRKTNGVGGWGSPGLFQTSDAQAGRAYRISFWLKTRGAVVRLRFISEGARTSQMLTPINESIQAEETGGRSWRQFVYDYTVPAEFPTIRVEMNVVAPGTVWIDNVRIDPL
jgi:hypothetical protein